MTLNQAIKSLQSNDHNSTWDEVQTIPELKECLAEAMTGYQETELTYKFYSNIYNSVTE